MFVVDKATKCMYHNKLENNPSGRDVRCELQIENDVCSSELMSSTRCGKSSAQANFDETFLL